MGDPLDWMRGRWSEAGEPGADHFTAMASILRAHQALVSELDRILKKHDLTRTGYLLMTTLQMSDEHTRPLGRLSRALMVHPTTVTLVMDQLEARGLAQRAPHPTDRRTTLAALTPAGLAAVKEATNDLNDCNFGLRGVSAGSANRLTAHLREIREALDDA